MPNLMCDPKIKYCCLQRMYTYIFMLYSHSITMTMINYTNT